MHDLSETHKLLADALNAEMNRFWTRFNIFSAVQIGAVVGLLLNADKIAANPAFTQWGAVLILGWSITGTVTTLRGYDLQRGLVLTLINFERALPPQAQYTTLVLKHSRFPRFITTYTCIAFSFLCVIFWVCFLIKGT